jgi:hypothetical protein
MNKVVNSALFFILFHSINVYASTLAQSSFSFYTHTEEINYQVTITKKTILSATLVVENVGDVAPAGYEVASAELISQKGVPSTFTFYKPDAGWPIGYYQILIKDNERVIQTVALNVVEAEGTASNEVQPTTRLTQQVSSGSGILARGSGGQLTNTAAHAYVDALTFVLAEMGQPRAFSQQERQIIVDNLATHYALFSFDTQQDLASAKEIFAEYRMSWNYLGMEEQKEFAYAVLSVAYGEQAAAQALGMNSGYGSSGGGSGGGGSSYYSNGASYASDGKCAIFSSEYGSISSC